MVGALVGREARSPEQVGERLTQASLSALYVISAVPFKRVLAIIYFVPCLAQRIRS